MVLMLVLAFHVSQHHPQCDGHDLGRLILWEDLRVA